MIKLGTFKNGILANPKGGFDVLLGNETREGADFHTEMEGRLRMDW